MGTVLLTVWCVRTTWPKIAPCFDSQGCDVIALQSGSSYHRASLRKRCVGRSRPRRCTEIMGARSKGQVSVIAAPSLRRPSAAAQKSWAHVRRARCLSSRHQVCDDRQQLRRTHGRTFEGPGVCGRGTKSATTVSSCAELMGARSKGQVFVVAAPSLRRPSAAAQNSWAHVRRARCLWSRHQVCDDRQQLHRNHGRTFEGLGVCRRGTKSATTVSSCTEAID